MKTSKLVLVSLATLMSAGILTACPANDGRTNVVFWHTFGKANQELLDTMIRDFEKENPDIKITASSQGGYPEIYQKLSSAIAAGDVPAMATCYADHVADYLKSNSVVDISQYLQSDTLGFTPEEGSHEEGGTTVYGAQDYVKGYWDEGVSYQKEGCYSVPYAKSTEVMFYNKDFFDRHHLTVPTTWDEMWALTKKITEEIWADKDFAGDDKDYYALGYDSDSNMYITLSEQMGIPYTTNENITKESDHYKFNNDQAKAMVQTLKGYYQKHYFITKGSMAQSSYTSTMFTQGRIVMTIGSTGGTTYNDSQSFNVGIAPVPRVDATHNQIISQGPSICFLRRVSQAQKEAAWKFYKFITKTTNSAYYAMDTGYDPVRISSYTCDYYREKMEEDGIIQDVFKVTSTLQDRYFSSPSFVGSANARTQVGGIFATYFTGAKTLDEAFNEAYRNCVPATEQ